MIPNTIGEKFLMSAKKVARETIKATLKIKRNTFINFGNKVLVLYLFIPNTILIPLGGYVMKLGLGTKNTAIIDNKKQISNKQNHTSRMEK